ncbi:MAG: ribosome small subunit-dependent GTPase A [Ornithinimicrobium sp.]|uniref:ribosome small subunit-dependent GTPase A n=1 Tax=Ornithinimicrobium sp. TaxID=1977084 RepID=UPI003D9AFCE1
MGRYDHYDEDSVRVRPSRRGSRPRTKDRPAHRDAEVGMVIAVDRGRYTTELDGRHVIAMRARELGRGRVVVGDRVSMVGDLSGEPDALARIVRIEDRRTVLRRSADDTDRVERVIVANADQLVMVTALADPEPRPRMIDRCLVAAYDAGLSALLVLTKADLADPGELVGQYSALDLPHVVLSLAPQPGGGTTGTPGLEDLRSRLRGRVSVLVGHSGVGKSTLVNALVPAAERATGVVNEVTGRGRHTSTSAVALPLDGGGWVVDTPGVRSFGLGHVDPASFVSHFPDLAPGSLECPRGCGHDEPECALDGWVAADHAGPHGPARLDSLRRLLRSRTTE